MQRPCYLAARRSRIIPCASRRPLGAVSSTAAGGLRPLCPATRRSRLRRVTPVHRVVLFFTGRSQAEIDAIASALHARAQEHGGFVGVLVDEHEVEPPPDDRP